MTELQPEALIAEAQAATGLDDFGADSFREGLAALCESLNADAQLNDLGNAAFPGMLIGSLANRLKVVDWIRGHPEVADERIEQPIVVIGMFRAGTTLPQPAVRPGSAQPRPAHVGGGRTACRRRRPGSTGPGRASTRCTPATRCSPRSTR